MLWKKSRALVDDLYGLLTLCASGLEEFGTAISLFYREGCGESFRDSVSVVKAWEDRADTQVREIKNSLFGNFLLPEAREDIARLLNCTDDIIDSAMHAVKYLDLRSMEPVNELAEDSVELVAATTACFSTFRSAAQQLFEPQNGNRVRDLVEETGRFESLCDEVENRMIRKIYTIDLDPFARILQADLVKQIGDISNSCEDAAAIVGIMNLKRVV